MEKKDEKFILGAGLRIGYEILKSNIKDEENQSVFDFIESLGKKVRKNLEYDPELKDVYQGADLIRKGKEFWNEIKKLISEDK